MGRLCFYVNKNIDKEKIIGNFEIVKTDENGYICCIKENELNRYFNPMLFDDQNRIMFYDSEPFATIGYFNHFRTKLAEYDKDILTKEDFEDFEKTLEFVGN